MSKTPLQDYSLISLCDATKVDKLYSIVPDDGSGDFTFARNSAATYLGADGLIKSAVANEPRIDFGTDGSYKGLLVEEQRTNLALYSEEFDDEYWNKTRSTITSNNATAPDGTMTADTFVVGNFSNSSAIVRTPGISISANQLLTISIFVKAPNVNSLKYLMLGATNNIVSERVLSVVDITNGEIKTPLITNGTHEETTVKFLPEFDGYRVVSKIRLDTTTSAQVRVYFSNNEDDVNFEGNGVDSAIIWGAQLEAASTASSYIKTEATTVTRVADILSNDLSALVSGDYSMVLDVEANVGRLKVFEALTGFEVDLTGSGRMVVTVGNEITLHFPDGRTLEFLKPSDFVDLEFVTKLTSNHVKVVATLNRIINQSEIDGLTSGNLNSPLLDNGAETDFEDKYQDLDYDFFGKIDTSSGTNFRSVWQDNNLTSFPLIDTSNGTSFRSAWRNNNLTSFPLIDTSSGTDFDRTWLNNNLTTFPLIDTSNGTNFLQAWRNNNLTSFPKIDTSSGVSFNRTWENNNLQTWPANMFDTCPATNFDRCWTNNALDQTGVDNILVSINKAREDGFSGSNGTLGIDGGTNATPSATGQAAADALRADGWTVNLNGY